MSSQNNPAARQAPSGPHSADPEPSETSGAPGDLVHGLGILCYSDAVPLPSSMSGRVEEQIDEPSAPHKTSVLLCPTCRVSCPLGFGVAAEGMRCHQQLPLSTLQRERRDQQRKLDAGRRQADELW